MAKYNGFTFKTVMILKLGELTRESLVVNFAFKLYRMADESVSTDNPFGELAEVGEGAGAARGDFGRAGNEHKFDAVYGAGDRDLLILKCPV